jgi:TPP-dependent pyruvate/acetoin dehydrogenase alpha subunit
MGSNHKASTNKKEVTQVSQRNLYTVNALEIYRKMYFSRHFELKIVDAHQRGLITTPIYLGIGQESIASTLSCFLPKGTPIFAQHRAHSYFLSFGGDPRHLKSELVSSSDIWTNGSGGSASVSSSGINMFGHSGLMGDQVPIAVGYALTTGLPTLAVVGDASVEEDYVMSSVAYAVKRSIPLLLICEDNNLSILTPKSVRRDWEVSEVAKAYGAKSFDINDDPKVIWETLSNWDLKEVFVINIRTTRHYWHAGSGQDEQPEIDRLYELSESLRLLGLSNELQKIEEDIDIEVESLWN